MSNQTVSRDPPVITLFWKIWDPPLIDPVLQILGPPPDGQILGPPPVKMCVHSYAQNALLNPVQITALMHNNTQGYPAKFAG